MHLTPKTLSDAAQSFGVELSALRPLGGMEGLACEYRSGDSLNVLKIIRAESDNLQQIQKISEKLTFINFLAENSVRVTPPIPSPQGHWVEKIQTEEGEFLITAAPKAAGKHVDLYDPRQNTPELFQAWGQVTGQMHRLAKKYPIWQKSSLENSISSAIFDWKDEHKSFTNWCQFADVKEKWIQLGEQMERLPQTREGFGLIHNDLHPWNFLVEGNQITVIDFDVCTFHWFVKDLAIALFFANWIGNPGKGGSKATYLNDFLHNFLKGYAIENILTDFWFEQLPLFLKHHQILLFTVFTDEWKKPNKWQAETLQNWKREILHETPVVKMEFSYK